MSRRLRRAAAALAAAALLVPAAQGQGFDFVALGDMPYGADAATGPAWRHLIELVNREQPPFTLHVGDLKDGITECSDELYARELGYFQRFDGALIFTPGDNDWTDCQRQGADPLERLQALRERFFPGPRSLGRRPIAVERQGDVMPAFARYRENLRWWHEGVLFASFHTVGPVNNAMAESRALRDEYRVREAANAAWIRAAFALARERGARALVFATQGDPLALPDSRRPPVIRTGFDVSFSGTLLPLARQAALPVLVVHGDSHRFHGDQPFHDAQGQVIANLWRLEVFGDPQMHAVKVHVDPAAQPPFRFTPIWNPMSPDPRR